jgi:hypothetical protein
MSSAFRNIRRGGAILALLVSAAITAPATPPVVTNLNLRGLQIGKVNTLTFTGTDLLPNPRILTTARLARQTLLKGATPNRIALEVELAPGTQPGFESWWLVTDQGVSARGVFATDSMAQEPLAAKAETLPIAMHGTLAASEVREVTFHGQAGQQIICEVEARRLESKLRPVLNLYGPGNLLVEFAMPRTDLHGDARIEARLPVDGEYRIQLHDLQYATPAPGYFCLKIGQWAYADLAFPPAIPRGVTTEVELVGSPGEIRRLRMSSATADVAMPAPWPEPEKASGPQAPVLLSDLREVVHQGDAPQPQPLGAVPVAVSARFEKPNEEHVYELTVTPESEVELAVEADALGSPIDATLELRDAKGTKLAAADDTPTSPDPRLSYKVPPKVTKILAAVRDGNGHAGPRSIYRLIATAKGKETPAGFALKVVADSCSVEPGRPAVLKVEALRDGYEGPIDLSFDHLPEGVKLAGQRVPAQATATLVTLQSGAALPEGITAVKGHGPDGEVTASTESTELARFQPWLAQALALAGMAKSDTGFAVSWGDGAAAKKVPLGGRVMLPVTCRRPPGHDGPVRLTLVTSEAKKFVRPGAVDNLNLREEKPMLIEEDKKAQAAFNTLTSAEASLTAAQKAAAAPNQAEPAAEEAQKKVELMQAAMTNAKKAAEEAARDAKNEVDFAVFVPAELPEIPHQMAFKAELLKRDRRTVEAVAYTPVQEIPVINPLALKFGMPAPAILNPKTGATVEIAGELNRLEGAKGDVNLTMENLPAGIAAPAAVTVKAAAGAFKFALKVPANFKPGEYSGARIVATGKPYGTLQVRSADHPVTLRIQAPEPPKPVAGETPAAPTTSAPSSSAPAKP